MRPRNLFLMLAIWFVTYSTMAQGIVWTGPTVTFSNAPGSDWTQPGNADHLTDSVWLTRKSTQGLFNYFEGGYFHGSSPSGTEWALGTLNNYATLTYSDWENCYGARGNLAITIVRTNAVVHLIADDIYFSIKFTYWGGNGGGFTYERSSPAIVPEPSIAALTAVGLLGWLIQGRR